MMIIIKIKGGLGNQMFQYAYALSLKQKGHKVYFDLSFYNDNKTHGGFQLYHYNLNIATVNAGRFIKHLFRFTPFLHYWKEELLLFNKSFLSPPPFTYIEGYFQSEHYFYDIRDIILKSFSLNDFSSYTQEIANKIRKSPSSCSIHIRRGDYLSPKNIKIHGVCSLEYYKKAINIISSLHKNIQFYIFSDDIEWVRQNLKSKNFVYIQNSSRIPHEDIYLMSLCKHNIIANSSFSWWGAWLNTNRDKMVIAPKQWFADPKLNEQAKDIYCKDWKII